MATTTSTSGSSYQFTGAISGLDTTSLIQAMLSAEKAPLATIISKRTALQAQQKAWETLRTQLTTLIAASKALATGGSAAARSATSSNGAVLAATADPGAMTGTYTVQVTHLATSTKATSTAAIGTAITSADLDTNLSALGLPGTITAGTTGIVVDGTIVSAAIGDPATTTLRQATDAMAAAIQAQIQTTDAGATVTAQISGNRLQFVVSGTTSPHTLSFGVSGDTSNAAGIFGLSGISGASLSDTTPVSGRTALGTVRTISTLDTAGLTGLTSTKTGSLVINGVAISYDTTVDSLSSIVTRINNSGAGVTASLDRANDKLVLTAKSGGASPISLTDATGTLAAALNLAPGTTSAQVVGSQASVTVDGTTYLSNTNTVSTAIDHVRLTLSSEGTSTVTVTPDVATMTAAIKAVVDGFNKLADSLDTLTANPVGGPKGDLASDSGVKQMALSFRSILTGLVSSSPVLKSLADLGVTTGKYGTAAAATKRLQFDSTVLGRALDTSPSAVSDVLTGAMGSLTTSIDAWTKYKGQIDSAESSITSQLSGLSDQEARVNERVATRQAALEAKFAAMEATLAKLQTTTSSLANSIAQQNKSTG
jgi:flagellar hook-associated protein 2